MSRLKDMYYNEIVPAMVSKFGYKNVMQVPKLDKIVLNMGVGEAKDNAKVLESAVKDMEIIAGQKVITTKAKNSVANFKISVAGVLVVRAHSSCNISIRLAGSVVLANTLLRLSSDCTIESSLAIETLQMQ